jgi:hypothetical protein
MEALVLVDGDRETLNVAEVVVEALFGLGGLFLA